MHSASGGSRNMHGRVATAHHLPGRGLCRARRLFFRYPELMENHGHRCACKDDDAYDGCCKKSEVNIRHEANPLS
jgi:hypothetical protein